MSGTFFQNPLDCSFDYCPGAVIRISSLTDRVQREEVVFVRGWEYLLKRDRLPPFRTLFSPPFAYGSTVLMRVRSGSPSLSFSLTDRYPHEPPGRPSRAAQRVVMAPETVASLLALLSHSVTWAEGDGCELQCSLVLN